MEGKFCDHCGVQGSDTLKEYIFHESKTSVYITISMDLCVKCREDAEIMLEKFKRVESLEPVWKNES